MRAILFFSLIYSVTPILSSAAEGKTEDAINLIEMSKFTPPIGKRCDFIETFSVRDTNADAKAKSMIGERKVGVRKNGGESSNYLFKLGTQLKHGGFPVAGSYTEHFYAAYYCYVPLNQ